MSDSSRSFTEALLRLGSGEEAPLDHLLPVVYEELREIARRQMRRERPDHTLQPTELVHEAYARLVESPARGVESRGHFVRLAARAMRRVLIDHARARNTLKRGGEWRRISLAHAEPEALAPLSLDLLALDEALERLAAKHPRCVETVELRSFSGLTMAEVAEVTGIPIRSVERDWRFALAWLFRELDPEPEAGR